MVRSSVYKLNFYYLIQGLLHEVLFRSLISCILTLYFYPLDRRVNSVLHSLLCLFITSFSVDYGYAIGSSFLYEFLKILKLRWTSFLNNGMAYMLHSPS